MPQESSGPVVLTLSEEALDALIERAAKRGAQSALCDIGLGDAQAGDDVRGLRNLLSSYRSAKQTAWTTIIKVLTTALLLAIMAGVGLYIKSGGTPPHSG